MSKRKKKSSGAPQTPLESAPEASKVPPCRQGAVSLTVYVKPDVRRALKVLAATKDSSIQALVCRGLDIVFADYGKPQIASRR